MQQLDRIGTFIGDIVESSVSTTKKGYPQAVLRLRSKKLYVEDAATMTHYGITEAGYVDYPEEEILSFLVLFNSAESFDDSSKLMNYDQLQIATGWDGTSFDALADASLVGKSIQFRTSEKKDFTNAEGKFFAGAGKIEVSWIDAADAPATRSLKSIDAAELKSLSAKLMKKPKVAAVAAPPRPAAAKPAPVQTVTPAVSVAPVAAAPVAVKKTPAAKKTTPAAPVAAPLPPPQVVVEESTGLPDTTTKLDAWNAVNTYKGTNTDDVITDAWISATGEVGEDKSEDKFTETDWAKVRDTVIRDCQLTVK